MYGMDMHVDHAATARTGRYIARLDYARDLTYACGLLSVQRAVCFTTAERLATHLQKTFKSGNNM